VLSIKVPGKLILSGEWSILENNKSCIVLPINKFVEVLVEETECNYLSAPDLDLNEINFVYQGGVICITSKLNENSLSKIELARLAIEKTLIYLDELGVELKFFKILINSEISSLKLDNGKIVKPGLGSSASVAVAVVKAILALHKQPEDLMTIFKLATIAHYLYQKSIGSGADIAAATFGQAIVYKRFDTEWLIKQIQRGVSLCKIVLENWDLLNISTIKMPQNFHLAAGFVGYSASTTELAKKGFVFKRNHPIDYNRIINSIDDVVLKLVVELNACGQKECAEKEILNLIKQNRKILKDLSDQSGAAIATVELEKMADIAGNLGAAAKLSGAGGGDCCIAICFDDGVIEMVIKKWQEAGFVVVYSS